MYDQGPLREWMRSRTKLDAQAAGGDYIPTWQVGEPQPLPNDIRSYAADGYSKNSLMYACIKEKATSFAALRPQVVRRDGSVAARHPMTALLENPCDELDGQEFAELMMTQFEVAGNVYVRKVRVSSNTERRAEFFGSAVQELELIRPDYVTIQPGNRSEQDVFVVTVEGRVVDRIPRRDMIHIKEPNLINDFYGLSKIALLVREGAIDLKMSDYELAFFNNAGVPMGLLSVKGKTSPQEITEIKSRFRSAYNGLRKWFDLLVLNADEASYTQMGMRQSDMEMDLTRAHVETRICSVFGVPPVIVGARVAQGTQQTYEEAQHAFWAETMVPAAMRFARAFEKHLLPEFAVRADAGAQATYDFTAVRALQEDRSRKLREVVRMINTGAFTVNEALTICGLPAQPNGDFYLRSSNQAEVRTMPDGSRETFVIQPSGDPVPQPANPLEGAAGIQLEQILRSPRLS